MKHFEEVTEAITRKRYTKTTCSKCKEIVPEQKGNLIRSFDLEMTAGTACQDGGFHKGWSVDLCDECVKWLECVLLDGGVELEPVETDW